MTMGERRFCLISILPGMSHFTAFLLFRGRLAPDIALLTYQLFAATTQEEALLFDFNSLERMIDQIVIFE
jgi:multisubunit Na+/H+ antiporter MnhB subunit